MDCLTAIIFRSPIFLFVHEQEDSCTLPLAPPKYCQVLFIFFFPGRLCRNRYCTFPDFQNRFDNICPYCLPVCPPVRRPFSRILRDRKRHILLEVRTGNIAGLSACPQGRNTPPSVCHISSVSVPAPHGFPSLSREGLCPRNSIFSLKK